MDTDMTGQEAAMEGFFGWLKRMITRWDPTKITENEIKS